LAAASPALSVEEQVPMLDEEEIPLADFNEEDTESDDETNNVKIQRDDLVNPYWIEERELGSGKQQFLSGHETQFWKDLISKYLEPLIKNKEKEKKQADELLQLRTEMVFSFFMLNAIWVVTIYMLQAQKETINIPWFFPKSYNVSYLLDEDIGPVVEIAENKLIFEPISLLFLFFFSTVLVAQVIGMLVHRWGTISHIISTTKFDWLSKEEEGRTGDGVVDKTAIVIAKTLQMEGTTKNEEKGPVGDGRRMTIHNIAANLKKTKGGEGAILNLEKEFRNKFKEITSESLQKSADPNLRRLSMNPKALQALTHRRSSYFEGQRRRSTIRRMSSLAYTNESFEKDSVISEGTDSVFSGRNNSNIVEVMDEASGSSKNTGTSTSRF